MRHVWLLFPALLGGCISVLPNGLNPEPKPCPAPPIVCPPLKVYSKAESVALADAQDSGKLPAVVVKALGEDYDVRHAANPSCLKAGP